MTRLSVNINKFATIRNARGGNKPDLIQVARDCERFGAQGITVHPRPDERHIRYADVYELKDTVKTEFNIEGNPKEGRYLEVVLEVKPEQATLVPDATNAITSNSGWDTITHKSYLVDTIAQLKEAGIRTSIFIDPVPELIEGAAQTGADRVELYTEDYARNYLKNPAEAAKSYVDAAKLAHDLGLGINAGHDLDLDNLHYFQEHVKHVEEVSIGHALVCDALYYGLENTIQLYLRELMGREY